MKKILLIAMLMLIVSLVNATNYYISQSGNDSNTGLSDVQAWKSLVKVNAFAFQPDDSVFFKGGDVWEVSYYLYATKPRLTLAASVGTVGHPVVVSSYGTGMAEFTAHGDLLSIVFSGTYTYTNWSDPSIWSEYSAGIWRITIGDIGVRRLWANGKELKKAQNVASISTSNPWRGDGGYVYLKCASNPATFYNSLKASNLDSKVVTIGVSNVAVDGIKVTGSAFNIANCDNVTVKNCEIGFKANSGGMSIYCDVVGDSINNIQIHDNKLMTGDSIQQTFLEDPHATSDAINLSNGATNCKIYNNYFHAWSHSAVYMYAPDASYPFNNNEVYSNYVTAPGIDYGRGFGSDYYSNGYNNSFHDNYVHDIAVGNQLNAPNIKFYNNIVDGIRNQPYGNAPTGGHGISIVGNFVDAVNTEVYNNTIIDCITDGLIISGSVSSPQKDNVNIHDNNFINNGWGHPAGVGYEFNIWWYGQANISNVFVTNNHLTGAYTDVVNYTPTAGYYADASTSITVTEFNALPVVNGNTFSGNDGTIDYSLTPTTNFVSSIQDLRFFYNYNQATEKTINFSGTLFDLEGTPYVGSITLQPLTSAILMVDSDADTTVPVVTAFTIPATSTSLTVSVSTFTATDNVSVTGYLLTESATAPFPAEGLWSATAQTNYVFTTEGTKTLYAWAKDAAGNVSSSLNDSVVITVTPPTRVAATYHKKRLMYHGKVMMF